jgi:hypothetical protein
MLFGKSFEKLINPTFSLEETRAGTQAKLTVLVDDGTNPPYEAYMSYIINPELFTRFGLMTYAHTHTALLKELCNTDLKPPEPCECKSLAWTETHPSDKVEYWSTLDGHMYPRPHTKLCPKNPKNRKKND